MNRIQPISLIFALGLGLFWTAPLEASFQARIIVRPLSASGAPLAAPSDTFTIPGFGAPYNVARTFSIGDHDYLLLLNTAVGDVLTIELDSNGHSMGIVGGADVGNDGFRNALIVRKDSLSRLFLFNPRDGHVRRYDLRTDGTLDIATKTDDFNSNLVDKTLFDAYAWAGDQRMFALDTFTGDAAVRGLLPASQITNATYTSGFTDLDHLVVNGDAYRLLYKEVGDPYEPAALGGAESGRFVVMQLGADGLSSNTFTDTNIGAGFTSVHFAQIAADENAVIAYNRTDGSLRVQRYLSLVPGLVSIISTHNVDDDFDEVLTYREGGTTYLVGVTFDEAVSDDVKLAGDRAGRLAHCVELNMKKRNVGYQLAILQGGEQVMNRASGNKRLSPSLSPMERSTKINMGSVGKMMTTISSFALADAGWLNLDASVFNQLGSPPGPYADWVHERTARDLMAQATGWEEPPEFECEPVGQTWTVDCSPFFENDPPLSCIDPPPANKFACPRSYYNAHFGALRQLIEARSGVTTTPDIVYLAQTMWLDDVLPDGPSCLADLQSKYFGICKFGETCTTQGGVSFVQATDTGYLGWSGSCGAGGWNASARDMVRLLEALNAGQVLSEASTTALFDTTLIDRNGDRTALGWDPPYDARSNTPNTPLVLGKDGATNNPGTQAYITNLEGHAYAALLANVVDGAPAPAAILQRAYRFAVGDLDTCRALLSYNRAHQRSEGAATEVTAAALTNEWFVTAVRDGLNKLRLTSWKRTPLELQRYDTLVDEVADRIQIVALGTNKFAVAYRKSTGDLRIGLYGFNTGTGAITKLHADTAGPVQAIALANVGVSGAELAVALKNEFSHLQVIAWDVTAANLLDRKDDYVAAGTIEGVSAVADPGTGQLIVAVRTDALKMRVIAFDISNDGMLVDRKAQSSAGDEENGKNIRITRVATDGGDEYYVTAMRNDDDRVKVIAWDISSSGNTVTRRGSAVGATALELGPNIHSGKNNYVFVPVLDVDSGAKVRAFELASDGQTIWEEHDTGTEDDVVASGIDVVSRTIGSRHFTTHVYLSDGVLKLANWEMFNGGF